MDDTILNFQIEDLFSIAPALGEQFLCPVCGYGWKIDKLERSDYDLSHVWPEYIRQKSNSWEAFQHQVILCKDCNQKAGSSGDCQMQEAERLLDEQKSGVFSKVNIQFRRSSGPGIINVRGAKLEKQADGSLILSGPVNKET